MTQILIILFLPGAISARVLRPLSCLRRQKIIERERGGSKAPIKWQRQSECLTQPRYLSWFPSPVLIRDGEKFNTLIDKISPLKPVANYQAASIPRVFLSVCACNLHTFKPMYVCKCSYHILHITVCAQASVHNNVFVAFMIL